MSRHFKQHEHRHFHRRILSCKYTQGASYGIRIRPYSYHQEYISRIARSSIGKVKFKLSLIEMSAQEVRAWRNLAKQLFMVEERSKLLGMLIAKGIGLREEEEFMIHEKEKFRGEKVGKLFEKKSKEMVAQTMKLKIKDNNIIGERVRRARNHKKGVVELRLGSNSRKFRWIIKDIKENCDKLRNELKVKYRDKVEFLTKKYDKLRGIEGLNKEDKDVYGSAKVFTEAPKPEESKDPVIVNNKGQKIPLNKDENSFLALGPKFCIPSNLNEEIFEVNVEECIMKY